MPVIGSALPLRRKQFHGEDVNPSECYREAWLQFLKCLLFWGTKDCFGLMEEVSVTQQLEKCDMRSPGWAWGNVYL